MFELSMASLMYSLLRVSRLLISSVDTKLRSEIVKICTFHLTIYQAAAVPLFLQLRQAALNNFMQRFEQITVNELLPGELCTLTEKALRTTEPHHEIVARILDCVRQHLSIVEKNATLVKILSKGCGWDWNLRPRPNGCSDVALNEVKAASDTNTVIQPTNEGDIVHIGESDGKRLELQGQTDQLKAGTPAKLNGTHQAPSVVQSTQQAHAQLQAVVANAQTEIKQLRDVIERGREANNQLKADLLSANTAVKDSSEKDNQIAELVDNLAAMAKNKTDIEKNGEIDKGIIKHLQQELETTKKDLQLAKAAQKPAPSTENYRLARLENENAKLNAALKDTDGSAQQRRVVILQRQLEDVKTKHEFDVKKLKDAIYDLKEDLRDAEMLHREEMQEVIRKKEDEGELVSVNDYETLQGAYEGVQNDLSESWTTCAEQSAKITNLEQRIEKELESRKVQADRAAFLEKRLQRNDELLQAQDVARKQAEAAADATQNELRLVQRAFDTARHNLEAHTKSVAESRKQVEQAQEKAGKASQDQQVATSA